MSSSAGKPCIRIIENGPYLVSGSVPLTSETVISDRYGTALEYRVDHDFPVKQTYSLCRCGSSKTMPFCDGSHTRTGFCGRETASREPFAGQAKVYRGPGLVLEDVEGLCMLARFCHLGGDTWSLIEKSDDPELCELAVRGACNCPAGRLVVRDAVTGEPIEPTFEPSIAVLHDEVTGASGPLWVRGGIQVISANGTFYEIRNRITLCRCGKSGNMPFCDASHIEYRFRG
jgi:CDGSH-type Zn-finger protein